jgi:cellobiose transport system substrate-binding protein
VRISTRKTWMAVAGATGVALLATACGGGSSDDDAAGGDEGGQITLTISTFNQFGYEDLLDEYMELNPDIKIEHNKFAKSDDAKEQFQTALGAGSGLADVVGVEVDWLPQMIQYSDQFTDLTSRRTARRSPSCSAAPTPPGTTSSRSATSSWPPAPARSSSTRPTPSPRA